MNLAANINLHVHRMRNPDQPGSLHDLTFAASPLSSLRNFVQRPYFHANSKVHKRPLSPKMVCLVHYLVIIILPHFPQSSGSTPLTNKMKRRRGETRHSSDSLAQDAARLDISSTSRTAGYHPATRHALTKKRAKAINGALAVWFPNVHDTRGMPWRKPFDPTLGSEARGQRAYEVCTSDSGQLRTVE